MGRLKLFPCFKSQDHVFHYHTLSKFQASLLLQRVEQRRVAFLGGETLDWQFCVSNNKGKVVA